MYRTLHLSETGSANLLHTLGGATSKEMVKVVRELVPRHHMLHEALEGATGKLCAFAPVICEEVVVRDRAIELFDHREERSADAGTVARRERGVQEERRSENVVEEGEALAQALDLVVVKVKHFALGLIIVLRDELIVRQVGVARVAGAEPGMIL